MQAEQEGENLSGLSTNPDKAIFAVRENGTTCLMVEFAVKFLVPYDVLALNGIDVRKPLTSPHKPPTHPTVTHVVSHFNLFLRQKGEKRKGNTKFKGG